MCLTCSSSLTSPGVSHPSGRLARALVAPILFVIARLGRPFLGRDSTAACGPKDPEVASRRPSSGGGAVRQKRSGGGQVADGLPPAAWVGVRPAPGSEKEVQRFTHTFVPSPFGLSHLHDVKGASGVRHAAFAAGIIMGPIYTSGFPGGVRAAWAPGSA